MNMLLKSLNAYKCQSWHTYLRITGKSLFSEHIGGHGIPMSSKAGHKIANSANKFSGKELPIEMMRNIGIMAHIDAGKTTTTERMLFYSGFTRHLGDIDHGDTVMDYMPQERDRGITITSAAITFLWNKHKINLIDTPGHVDFTLEVERALRVLDGAIAVLDASAGVEAQTLTVWRQADRYRVPRIVYLNKMDKASASFQDSVSSLIEKLHVLPLITQIPIGHGNSFKGIVDIVGMDMLVWDKDTEGRSFKRSPLTHETDADLFEEAMENRTKLIEQLADINDDIAEYFLNDTDHMSIPKNAIHNALRKATLSQKGIPILCGSSYKNKGVQPLLDAVIKYLPNPAEIHHDFVHHYKGELCGLAFKLVHDKHHGPLTFVRLYSGNMSAGTTVYNVNRECTEKVARLLQVYADDHKEISQASGGNIVAVSGLKETFTGDTVVTNVSAANSARKHANKHGINEKDEDEETLSAPVLAGLLIPDPVFFCSIEVASLAYQKQFDLALANLTREDPSLRVHVDQDTGQTILSGMGELHLEIIKSRIEKEYNVEVDLGPLQISYRETILQHSEQAVSFDKTIGKDRHRVSLCLSVRPKDTKGEALEAVEMEPSKGADFDPKRVHRTTLMAVNAGVKSALSRGPVLGFPVLDVCVSLHDLRVRYGTSLPMVSGAASQAVYQALQGAAAVLLEPLMDMQIHTDESYLGSVLSDLSPRRCQIQEIQARHEARTIHALVPLSELRGYSTKLRTLSSGTASFSMQLAQYQQMSEHDQRQAVQQVTGFAPL